MRPKPRGPLAVAVSKEPRYRLELTQHDGWEWWEHHKSKAKAQSLAQDANTSGKYADGWVWDTKTETEITYPGQPERTHADPRGA